MDLTAIHIFLKAAEKLRMYFHTPVSPWLCFVERMGKRFVVCLRLHFSSHMNTIAELSSTTMLGNMVVISRAVLSVYKEVVT